jgi:hypothetical protein
MPRTTLILALIQMLLAVLGFVALGCVLWMAGYPDNPSVRWNPLAAFLREHGVWLLLLPPLWMAFATYAQKVDRGALSYSVACAVGIGLAALIIALYLYAAVFPYTRPFFMG